MSIHLKIIWLLIQNQLDFIFFKTIFCSFCEFYISLHCKFLFQNPKIKSTFVFTSFYIHSKCPLFQHYQVRCDKANFTDLNNDCLFDAIYGCWLWSHCCAPPSQWPYYCSLTPVKICRQCKTALKTFTYQLWSSGVSLWGVFLC